MEISRCLKHNRDIGKKAVLSDVATAFPPFLSSKVGVKELELILLIYDCSLSPLDTAKVSCPCC